MRAVGPHVREVARLDCIVYDGSKLKYVGYGPESLLAKLALLLLIERAGTRGGIRRRHGTDKYSMTEHTATGLDRDSEQEGFSTVI